MSLYPFSYRGLYPFSCKGLYPFSCRGLYPFSYREYLVSAIFRTAILQFAMNSVPAPTQELETIMDLWYKQENDSLHKELSVMHRRYNLQRHIVEMNRSIIHNTRYEKNVYRRILEEIFGHHPELAVPYENLIVFTQDEVELVEHETDALGEVIDYMLEV